MDATSPGVGRIASRTSDDLGNLFTKLGIMVGFTFTAADWMPESVARAGSRPSGRLRYRYE